MKKLLNKKFLISFVMTLVMCVSVIPMTESNYEANEMELKHGIARYSDEVQSFSEMQGTQTVETQLYTASISSDYGAHYYRNQLSKDATYIYDLFEDNIEKMYDGKTGILVTGIPSGTLKVNNVGDAYQYAVDAFKADHSEVFWIDFTKIVISYSYRDNYVTKLELCLDSSEANYYITKTSDFKYNGKYLTNFGGKTPFTNASTVKTAVNNMKKQADACLATVKNKYSTYEVVKGIHDWLVNKIKYNLNYFDQSGYSALVYGQSVCAGYVNAFNYIARQAGIETIQVSGVGKSKKNGGTENHAWNYVKVNGKWYALDITWDDPSNVNSLYHDFFLVGNDTVPKNLTDGMKFSVSHTVHNYFTSKDISFALPTLNKTAYVYDGVEDLKPTPTPAPTPTPQPAPSDYDGEFKIGDAWQDGEVTLQDAQYVLRGALILVELTEIERKKADVDFDDQVTLQDAQKILRAALILDVLVEPSDVPDEQPSQAPEYGIEIIAK